MPYHLAILLKPILDGRNGEPLNLEAGLEESLSGIVGFLDLGFGLGAMNFRSLEEFWPVYMNQHSKAATRRWHFAGTLCSMMWLIYSVLFNWWCVIFVPLFGYGLAWYSHFFVEKNVPATFGHPFWSLLCDFKMFGLMLTGQMDREIKRLGKRPVLQAY
nr:uncharacterized protein LOC105174534 [Ipomoea batatas]